MAKVLKLNEPKERTVDVRFKESELALILGIIHDLADNPQRKVTMNYGVDLSTVTPTKYGLRLCKKILAGLKEFNTDSFGPDYFELWEEVNDECTDR